MFIVAYVVGFILVAAFGLGGGGNFGRVLFIAALWPVMVPVMLLAAAIRR